jgi:hypothetical protein
MDSFGTETYGDEDRGRCRTCGFFGRVEITGASWHEATPPYRRKWWPLGERGPDGNQMYLWPGCVVGAFDLQAEAFALQERVGAKYAAAKEAGEPQPTDDAIELVTTEIIDRDRQCAKWFPYQPGLGPREHVERFHVLQLEQQRQAHELRVAEIEAGARQSSEKIQADSLEIAKALHKATEATGRFTTKWTYIAVSFAVVGVVLVGLTYLFPELGRHIGEWIDRTLNYPLGRP